jgi:hypothetical protein
MHAVVDPDRTLPTVCFAAAKFDHERASARRVREGFERRMRARITCAEMHA